MYPAQAGRSDVSPPGRRRRVNERRLDRFLTTRDARRPAVPGMVEGDMVDDASEEGRQVASMAAEAIAGGTA